MIDDIVVLPTPLRNLRGPWPHVSSEQVRTLPLSNIVRIVGYESPNDDDWYKFGAETDLPVGKDAWHKIKLVESSPAGICEFYCLVDRPVDTANPYKSKKAQVYCIGVSVIDRNTERVTHRYVLWRNIFELMHFITEDSIIDAPAESVIANEIRLFAQMYGRPDIAEYVKNYPGNYEDVLISEIPCTPDDHVDSICQLGSNIKALNEITDLNSRFDVDPLDVFRGVQLPNTWTDLTPIRNSHLLQLLQFGSVDLGELLFLASPTYHLHPFTRPVQTTQIPKGTALEIDARDGIFSIIKYAGRLPYNEFKLVVGRTLTGSPAVQEFEIFGRFGKKQFVGKDLADHRVITGPILQTILEAMNKQFPNFKTITVLRSWKEEIYITVLNVNGAVETYYFDLFAGALCSQSLIRDYAGPMFC